jgi:hypothetical protein
MSFSSAYAPSHSTVPPPSAPGISGVLPGQQAVNTTRILSLTGFSKDLKTRDIQAVFIDYEDDRGGYRIKWIDDTGCLLVFNDAMVGEWRFPPTLFFCHRADPAIIAAKRAFLNLTANPHPSLMPIISSDEENTPSTFPKLIPYDGEDAANIVASVATRPRSRSIAQNNGPSGGSPSSGNGSTHSRRMSSSGGRNFSRGSISQYQMQAIMDDAKSANRSPSSPTKETAPAANGGAIDWEAVQQQAATQIQRPRTGSASGTAALAFSPPTSPERGLGVGQRAGAVSPSTLRRLVSVNRS